MSGMTREEIGDSGHTLEELAAYHERGRTPAIPAIDGDAQCRAVLDSMDRLGALSRELIETDARDDVSETWFQQILGEVARESRAGRDLPLVDDDPVRVVVTEGAVRGLVRDAGDAVEGVLVERVHLTLHEDVRVDVRLTISVLDSVLGAGRGLARIADSVRERVRADLEEYGGWTVGVVDVTIDSLRLREEER
ncbi:MULTISPECIES: Asp23/Gls24 family envelope stress response protein [Microbacterium]|uniref:Asp23/Gls24 family envelope stress response protein n=2 Tax=Microbacteriaceae TaxID=85023 RepID=UPI000429BCE5|nr:MULTISPECIES: Asp23/Gls24 family envelope stress response protein [Microbacterium]MDC7803412.1 hypothetical protein [Sphingomonas sp. BLCC-B65]